MQNVRKIQRGSSEVEIAIEEYRGRNTFGNHSALTPADSRELINWDLFQGLNRNYIKSRRGTAPILPDIGLNRAKRNSFADVINAVTWDIGAEEYLITQEGTKFFATALIATDAPVPISMLGGGVVTLGDETRADMFVADDLLYIFHPTGNYLLQWDGSEFKGLPMGLAYPYIETIMVNPGTPTNPGINGRYTYGIEKVYYRGASPIMASSPNRVVSATGFNANTGTIEDKYIHLEILATSIDTDSVWTHLRVWRSLNQDVDLTDPLNPIDAEGSESELYEEALISRAEINAVALAHIATGVDGAGITLPTGNAGVMAGKPGGVYTIRLSNTDDALSNFIDIDRIELLPLPAARLGCFHAKRIYVSAVEDATLDDESRNNIYYSLPAGTQYGTQYDPLNYITTGGDGIEMKKLISMEQDLIGIKTSETGRLQGGNIDLPWETMDQKIGILNSNLAAFLPAVGIVAITNDFSDFRIFGYDLRWSNVLNGLDISIPVREDMAALDPEAVSFAYLNGKLWVSNGAGFFFVLHDKEKRGWSQYRCPMNGRAERIFTFAGGTRGAVVSRYAWLVEVDVDGLDTDYDTFDDTTDAIELEETTWRFQSNDGRDNLEHHFLSLTAQLSTSLTITPFVNGYPWPTAITETPANVVPDPGIMGGDPLLQDREYRLYLQPATIGSFLFCRLRGNFVHYTLNTTAPAVMRSKKLLATLDEDGMGTANFDPFQKLVNSYKWPDWGPSNAYLIFNFEEDSDNLVDQSGNNRHHTYTDGAGSRTFLPSYPPGAGAEVFGGAGIGYNRPGFTAMDFIGDAAGLNSRDLVFRWVINYPASAPIAYNIQAGGDGTYFWAARLSTDARLTFILSTSSLSYRFVTSEFIFDQFTGAELSEPFTAIFLLTDGGQTGRWFLAPRAASSTSLQTTLRLTYTPGVTPVPAYCPLTMKFLTDPATVFDTDIWVSDNAFVIVDPETMEVRGSPLAYRTPYIDATGNVGVSRHAAGMAAIDQGTWTHGSIKATVELSVISRGADPSLFAGLFTIDNPTGLMGLAIFRQLFGCTISIGLHGTGDGGEYYESLLVQGGGGGILYQSTFNYALIDDDVLVTRTHTIEVRRVLSTPGDTWDVYFDGNLLANYIGPFAPAETNLESYFTIINDYDGTLGPAARGEGGWRDITFVGQGPTNLCQPAVSSVADFAGTSIKISHAGVYLVPGTEVTAQALHRELKDMP